MDMVGCKGTRGQKHAVTLICGHGGVILCKMKEPRVRNRNRNRTQEVISMMVICVGLEEMGQLSM